ncbi:MAG: ankyrin repeat domain-containing protein, partial [Gammaproteobacteria bacterium]
MMPEPDTARFILGLIWQQLWLGTALVAFAGLCLRAGSGWNAATRHWVWVLVLLAVALLPLAALLPEPATVSGSPATVEFSAAPVATDGPGLLARVDAAAGTDSEIDPAMTRWLGGSLVIFWLTGSLWMLFRLAGSVRAARRLKRESSPAPMPSFPAGVRLSALARSPMVVGLWRPSILIPTALFAQMPRVELLRILDHELAHVRRRDQWIMLIQRLIESVYFFHPGVRFAARRLEEEREISCDDCAAAGQRESYASSLVGVCRSIVSKPSTAPLAVGVLRSRGQLARRIAHLLDGRRNHSPDASPATLAFSAIVLVAIVAAGSQFMPRLALAGDPAAGRNVDPANRYFGMPLIESAARGDLEGLEALIDAGADPNLGVPGDGTPLIVAARAGHLDAVVWLLDHGADAGIAIRGDGNPLIMAAAHGRTEVVRLLLDRGADIDAIVPDDETALISAARNGAIEPVRLLLERGANVDIAVPVTRFDGTREVRT